MVSFAGFGRAVFWGAGLVALSVGAAKAQVPVLPPESAEISACLCLDQAVKTLRADMDTKNQALNATTQRLADLDTQLARERPQVNVNNPDSVARYKVLLEQRDAAYRQSIGPVHTDATQATARYNVRVNEYNARCANRPFNSALVAAAQAHLMCPPLQ
jgi:hypothetical protein